MTKQDIINHVSAEANLSRAKAEEAVETVIKLIKESLGQGETVILRRFGSFQVKEKSKRMGRNPKTGEVVPLPRRAVPLFKYSNDLKVKIAGSLAES